MNIVQEGSELMTTKETSLFCARQIECVLRYVQSVYQNEHELENHLSMASVMLESLSEKGKDY